MPRDNLAVAPAFGLSVSQVTQHIRSLMETDPILQDVLVYGEVSNLTRSAAGHVYFTLKDAESSLRCVMWRSRAQTYSRLPDHGESILARGYISLYPPQGQYQLYVDEWQALGAGRLHMEFEALKARLEAEGLFDPARKRPLPAFPRAVGVVTSPGAAAYQDILRVLKQRYPLARVVLAPTLVQGEMAPAQIVGAIHALNRERTHRDIDVIIVARGGGSLEELWAFNDEHVARAIAASDIPVITGVGHEIDFTIADFAADYRAPTPTAAAAAAVPDQRELRQVLAALEVKLTRRLVGRLESLDAALRRDIARLERFAPQARVEAGREHLGHLHRRLALAMEHRLTAARERVEFTSTRLQALDPRALLERGYAIVRRRPAGEIISRVGQVAAGDHLEVRVSDGSFGVHVE